MKMTIQKAVEYARDDSLGFKKHMDEHGVSMPSSVTFYGKDVEIPLMQVQIPTELMEAPMKQIAHASTLALGAFIGVDYVTIATDTFVSKMDKNETNQEKIKSGDYVRPKDDVNAKEAIMILGVSKEGKVINSLNMYGRDDLGNMYYTEQNTFEHDRNDENDNEFSSWMLEFATKTFHSEKEFKEMGIDFDPSTRVSLLMTGMKTLAEMDFMFAFTEPLKDYFINQLGGIENISDEVLEELDIMFAIPTEEDGE